MLRTIALAAMLATPANAASLDGATMSWPWALPFAGLLLTIAVGPALFAALWHAHYGKIASLWATLALAPIAIVYGLVAAGEVLTHAVLGEFLSFIVVLFALYTVAGGIVVTGSLRGTPLGGHQHVAFALAEMEMEIQASRLLVHRAAWMADHRMDNVSFASMSKAHAARTAQMVTTRAMALLGEEALEPGHPVEKWYRDAKIYDIFEGTGQIQRRIIAKNLTGLNAI